jgi:hypothetical protein
MKKNPLNKGIIMENAAGIGAVTPAMVEARARELAAINGRSQPSEADFQQVKRELTGEAEMDPHEESSGIPSPGNRETVRKALSPEGLRWQYSAGVRNPDLIAPEGYTFDAAMIARPGNMDIQLDLFLDYANNVKLYPAFQEYFREAKPPIFAIWGKHDPFFIPAGA